MKWLFGMLAGLGIAGYILGVALTICLTIGWFLNLFKIINECDFEAPYKAEAIRIVGVFAAPVGGVVGWIDIEDGNKKVVISE